MPHSASKLRNSFAPSEWAGAVGDLGTMLPLAFALVIFNGYTPHRLFFLWGLVFVVTGFYFRVPVAVQPLKAMTVIAIASGFAMAQLATTAFFFGLLIFLLSVTGFVRLLERWFTPALVRGIQLGIGLILLHKAVALVYDTGLYVGMESISPLTNILLAILVIALLGIFQLRRDIPLSLPLIVLGTGLSLLFGVQITQSWSAGSIAGLQIPEAGFLGPALLYLIIPQLPLTLGNAIYAASDACHTFWPDRSQRVRPASLGLSIGISNVVIGLSGGFPICHGAGGIAAHAKFGGKTGGTTIVIGGILIISALVKPLADLLFYIPIPILGALLAIASWGLIVLIGKLETRTEVVIASVVGLTSFITRNITIAILSGILLEYALNFAHSRMVAIKGEKP